MVYYIEYTTRRHFVSSSVRVLPRCTKYTLRSKEHDFLGVYKLSGKCLFVPGVSPPQTFGTDPINYLRVIFMYTTRQHEE